MGISNAIFRTALPNTASEEKTLLLNVETSPHFKKSRRTIHEYRTRLVPEIERRRFREFQAFLTLSKPELVVLASVGRDHYVRVHTLRNITHPPDDVQGALALSLFMGDYELASTTGTCKPDRQSLSTFLQELNEEYAEDAYEFAFVGLSQNGFKKSGRDELLTEALYTFVCGRVAS